MSNADQSPAMNRAQRRYLQHESRKGKDMTPQNKSQQPLEVIHWEELLAMYHHCNSAMAILDIPIRLCRSPEYRGKVTDPKALVDMMEELDRDTQTLRRELEKIKTVHTGRVGEVSLDEYHAVMVINNQYSDFLHRFYALVIPNVASIAGLYGLTMNQASQETNIQLPQDAQTEYGNGNLQ